MAINASAEWWVRTDGNVLNGGGYDAAISGAGTNYCDQASPQLSLSDFATSGAGSTTLTSATGGFTSAMIGNCVRIASGTNFQTGYYFITGYTDTNTVTVDRTPTSGGAGSGGVGRIGGAFAHLTTSFSAGGEVTAAAVTSPLAPGHTIHLRGTGSDDPSSADYSQSGYMTTANGDQTTGPIRVVGYNGRPCYGPNGYCFHSQSWWRFENIKFKFSAANNGGFGLNGGGSSFFDVIVDQAGYDVAGIALSGSNTADNVEFRNSGGTTAGNAYYAISMGNVGGVAIRCTIKNWRGLGINCLGGGAVIGCIIQNTKNSSGPALRLYDPYNHVVHSNVIIGAASHGILFGNGTGHSVATVFNNIIMSCGGYGMKADDAGTEAQNTRRSTGFVDYNAFYNNTSGARSAIAAGAHDIALTGDPFEDSANSNFKLNNGAGLALKATGFPTTFPGMASTISYPDVGAAQRQEAYAANVYNRAKRELVAGLANLEG